MRNYKKGLLKYRPSPVKIVPPLLFKKVELNYKKPSREQCVPFGMTGCTGGVDTPNHAVLQYISFTSYTEVRCFSGGLSAHFLALGEGVERWYVSPFFLSFVCTLLVAFALRGNRRGREGVDGGRSAFLKCYFAFRSNPEVKVGPTLSLEQNSRRKNMH